MATLIYSNSSLRDIENIKEFISTGSISNANHFIKSIRDRISLLKKHPEIGTIMAMPEERFKHIDSVIEEIILLDKIEKGLDAVKNGEVLSKEEIEKW